MSNRQNSNKRTPRVSSQTRYAELGMDGLVASGYGGPSLESGKKPPSHYNLARPPKSNRPPLNAKPVRRDGVKKPTDPNLDFNLNGEGFG